MAFPVVTIQFKDLLKTDFNKPEATIYEILWDGVKYELLINYKENSKNAVIFGAGDVNSETKTIPQFSRNTWHDAIGCSAIYYSDPTLYKSDTVGLCWCYGTNDCWYLERIAFLVYTILKKWNISTQCALFYGSSGGGFTAMMLATLLGSNASAINPQVFIQNFWHHKVESLKQVCLQDGEEFINERIDFTQLIIREGYFPKLHIIQNITAERDMQTQQFPFLTFCTKNNIDITGRLNISYFTHELGHKGMPENDYCIDEIKSDIEKFCYSQAEQAKTPFMERILNGEFDAELANYDATPFPKIYIKRSIVVEVSDKLMTGELVIHEAIPPLEYNFDTLDWNLRYSRIPNTFQLYLQGLTPMGTLIAAYQESDDVKYLAFAEEFLDAWIHYAQTDKDAPSNPYFFVDHSVALRTEHMLIFAQMAQKAGYWNEKLANKIYNLLIWHGEWLFSDEHYARNHNHGIIHDQALIHVAFALNKSQWLKKAKERLIEQKENAFNSEMVHTENSNAYHSMVADMFLKIGNFLKISKDPLGEIFMADAQKAKEYTSWTRLPNGYTAQVGDTGSLYDAKYTETRVVNETHKVYPFAGVYFYRSNKDEQSIMDTWKNIKSGFKSNTHKHADECSFILYSKGYEIFSDSGVYGYAKDDFRAHIISAKAHNTIVVDNESYIVKRLKSNLAGMESHNLTENYDHVRMFNHLYKGVMFFRNFYSMDDATVIVDELSSADNHIYSQIFNLSEHMEILNADKNEVVIKIADSGYIARLRQFGTIDELSVINGDVNTPGYGLISRGTNNLGVTTTLKFDMSCSTGKFITLITIEDKDGNVRLINGKTNINDISYSENDEKLIFGNLAVSLNNNNS